MEKEDEIKKLIKTYEAELRSKSIDQMTDDAMPRKMFEGIEETFKRVIADLKKLVE